jgi:tRNA(Ile)-lysidine synthase
LTKHILNQKLNSLIAGKILLTPCRNRLLFSKTAPTAAKQFDILIRPGESVITPQGRVKLTKINKASFPPPKAVLYLNAAAVQGELSLRLPENGDKFSPFGMKTGHKLLSDYFTDKKVYGAARVVPLLCDEIGIAAICGFTIDERFRVNAETEAVLMLSFEKSSEDDR